MPTKLHHGHPLSKSDRRRYLACLLLVWLAGCTASTAPTRPRPGCDRNGDYEQRIAC